MVRLSLVTVFLVFLIGPNAFALNSLSKLQSGENRVTLRFDSAIKPSQIKTEYLGDTVQVSLQDVSVYPAKIVQINGPDLKKAFVYQFGPKTVRLRLSVAGKAESFSGRLKVQPVGKTLTFSVLPERSVVAKESDQVKVSRAHQNRAAPLVPVETAAVDRVQAKISEKPVATESEKATAQALSATTVNSAANISPKSDTKSLAKIGAARPLPSISRVVVSFALVLGLLLATLFVVKRAKSRSTKLGSKNLMKSRGFKKLLSGFEKLGFSQKQEGPKIDVISTHYLGPKNSIAVVKIGERQLVLGISSDSIQLITDLDTESVPKVEASRGSERVPMKVNANEVSDFLSAVPNDLDLETLAIDSIGKNSFDNVLDKKLEVGQASSASAVSVAPMQAPRSSARDRIRSRVESMRSLS